MAQIQVCDVLPGVSWKFTKSNLIWILINIILKSANYTFGNLETSIYIYWNSEFPEKFIFLTLGHESIFYTFNNSGFIFQFTTEIEAF